MIRFRLAILALLMSACSAGGPLAPTPAQTLAPARAPLPADTGWRAAIEGIETRELDVMHRGRRDRLYIARVDPKRVTFRVRYDPNQPRRVGQWMDAEHARLIVNGGFFDPDNRVLGLLIADGISIGQSYEGLGGLFGVSGGRVQVRSLIHQPYQLGESFEQMLQSFPTLLVGSGLINDQIRDDGRLAPRSVVGIDRTGCVVFLVSPRATFSVAGLADWLAQSDLDLDSALNLDGGTSSGLMVRTDNGLWGADSWVEIPAVIVVK